MGWKRESFQAKDSVAASEQELVQDSGSPFRSQIDWELVVASKRESVQANESVAACLVGVLGRRAWSVVACRVEEV